MIEQGEDDGHQWFRVEDATLNLDIESWEGGHTYCRMADSSQQWKGCYQLAIPWNSVPEFLDKLQQFINDTRIVMASPNSHLAICSQCRQRLI